MPGRRVRRDPLPSGTGSGVFALASLALLLGLGPLRTVPGRVAILAGLGAIGALLVDIYLC